MAKLDKKDNWRGANNVADPLSLPSPTRYETAEFVVEAHNVDVTTSGAFRRRAGIRLVDVLTWTLDNGPSIPDSMFKLGDRLVGIGVLSGEGLGVVPMSMHPVVSDIVRIPMVDFREWAYISEERGLAIRTAVEHNGELFGYLKDGRAFRTDGRTYFRPWGVTSPLTQDSSFILSDGAIPPGSYKVAVTTVNRFGEEGAPTRLHTVQSGVPFSLSIDPDIAYSGSEVSSELTWRIYMSADMGSTLYLQKEYTLWGDTGVRTHRTSGEELTSFLQRPPPPADLLCSHNGVILLAVGKTVFVTNPFRPHQVNMLRGFFQYPSAVTNIVSTGDGVFVTADKTYYLRNLETDDVAQDEVFDLPAVRGTAKRVAESKAVWLTKYGIAVGVAGGKVEFLHRAHYAMPLMDKAEVGFMEVSGNELLVVMPRGQTRRNPLAYDTRGIAAIMPPPD